MISPKIIISVIVILILGTILGMLATETWSPSWNPFKKVPSFTIEKAIAELLETESFEITGQIEGEFESGQDPESKSITTVLSYSGMIDKSDKEALKTSADLDLELGMEGIILQMKGEIRSFDKDIYLRIISLPAFPLLGFDLEGIKNQWIKIDTEELRELTEEQEELLDKKTEIAFLQDLKNLLIGKEIFKVKKNLGEEELDGVKVKHYLAEMNKESLEVLIPEIFQLTKKYLSEEERITYEEDLEAFLEDFSENFDEFWRNIKPLEFDFWIEKGDWLRRMKFEKEIEYISSETEDTVQIKLGIDFKFSDFNKKFEIEIPKNFKLIEEFLSSSLLMAPEGPLSEEYFTPEYFTPEPIPGFELPLE